MLMCIYVKPAEGTNLNCIYSVSVVDLLDVPLPITGIGEN